MNGLASIMDTDYGNVVLNEIYGENKLKSRAEIEKQQKNVKVLHLRIYSILDSYVVLNLITLLIK